MIFLFKNFALLKNDFPDILDKVKQKIESKEVDYISSRHHPLHRKLIDKPFLLILDSFFLNLIEIIENLNAIKVLDLINIFSEIVQNSEIYNSNLRLKSKDFYRFKTLLISIKLFNEKQIYKKEEIDLYINLIKNERKMLLENKMNLVAEEIQKQVNLLIEKLPNCKEKTETIMKILISKYKEVIDINCREILCDKVLEDINLIKISNEFFIRILDIFSFTPDSLDLNNDNSDNPFSKSVESNKNYPLLKKINEKENCIVLKENLKYIFKFKISQYYNEELSSKKFDNTDEKIREEINTYLGEQSLLYFKNAHNTLIEIIHSNEKVFNQNIKKIFCIVYCNFFLEKFVYYLVSQKNLITLCKTEIINYLIEGSGNNNDNISEVKKTFKLFILKELKSKYILERTEFLNIDKWKEEYSLKDLFQDLKFEKKENKELEGCLDNIFLGGYEIEDLKAEKQARSLTQFNRRILSETQFLCNIDLFINDNLSTLKTENGFILCQNSGLMKNFNNYINTNSLYSKSTKKLIDLFFKQDEYINKLSNTIKETNAFEILLYAYKFSILCSLSNNNSIFSKMIGENCLEKIKNSYIPGADLYCDLWVESYLNMKKPISKHHSNGYCDGYYICDCGEYYFQVYCGVPIDISICANCHKKIGGLKEKLVIRDEDHGEYKIMRIYPDEKNKNDVQQRQDLKKIYGKKFENGYPNKIFKDFEEEMIKKMNQDYMGIFEPSYLFFIKETKNIRNLSQITYRLLNFIVYSNIYFNLKCGFLSLEDINNNKYIPVEEKDYEEAKEEGYSYNDFRMKLLNRRKKGISDEKNIIEIIRLNWTLLEKQLKEKNVNNIQIFINCITKDLFFLIKDSTDMSTPEKRNLFETEIESLVNKHINNYKNNSENYLRNAENIRANNLEIEYQILEKENMINNVESKYPFYYEFLSIPLVDENDIKELLKTIEKAEKKYPVLCSYLNTNKNNIKYLQTFIQINNFVNYTIERYSNAISRVDAKKIKIKDELGKNIPKNIFNDFLKAFNDYELYKIATKYECHELKGKITIRKFSKEDYLSNFLIDNGVQDYGMQLAALYQKYISFQNNFLNDVIYNIPVNDKDLIKREKLEYLKEKIKEEINPQKANKYNVLSFDISTENFNSFNEMVLFYSYKDSFNEKFEFDFSKKDKIKFNLEDIEEQLEYILLPGKKKFNNKIDYVIYQFEGFRNQNSSILSTFINMYPQKELNEEEKKILYEFRNEQYSTEVLIKILFSMQLMITFYNEQSTWDNNTAISDTINGFPTYFKIPEETKSLFRNPFTISQIISVYEYFELLCFEEFKKNVDPSYNQKISEEKKECIGKYFDKNKNTLINKLIICTTIRKFISRSLVGIREDLEIGENIELFSILLFKEDCWNKEIYNNNNFEQAIEQLKTLDIRVGEILDLYDILGGDKVLLGDKIKDKEDEKEEEKNKKEKKSSTKNSKKKRIKSVF